MTERSSIDEIRRLVERLARRVRFQRALDNFITGATLGVMLLMLTLVLFKTGWIELEQLQIAAIASALVPLAFAVAGWLSRLDEIALAQRIDRSHRLHDRISTALALAEQGRHTEFEAAQVADALRHLDQIELAPAAPFRRPADLMPFVIVMLALGGLSLLRPPAHDAPLPLPPEIRHDPVLDSATVALERDRLEAIHKELQGVQDEEAEELLEEIDKLLDAVEAREISEKQFLEEIDRIEKEFFEKQGQDETEKLAEKLKEAAEKLEQENEKELEKSEEAKELVEALKKKDLDAAAKALEKVAEKMLDEKTSEKELERLAKMLEKFSKAIDPTDPELQKMLEKHKELVDKLAEKFKDKQLSPEEKQRLERAKKELDKLQKQKQEQEKSESSRQLKRLQRASKKLSEEGRRKRGDKNTSKDERDAGTKKDPDYQNEAGREAKQAQRDLEKKGEQQKADKAKEMARRQLDELREAMRRSSAGNDSGESESDSKKGEQIKEFLRRAKGQQAQGGQQGKPQEQSGNPNAKAGELQPSERPQGGTRDPKKGDRRSDMVPDPGKTNQAGKGKGDRELGEETKLDGKRVDTKVSGRKGEGASRSEIIKSASEEGFATTEYKDVYVDYSSVVEEVMEKEKIPAGYRFYIKRYFQLIKPQE